MEIKFNNLTYFRDFDTKWEHPVLSKISLSFEEGKINGLVSTEGATIGELITLIIKPSSGELCYENMCVSKKSYVKNIAQLRKKIAYLPRSIIIFEEATVYDEIGKLLSKIIKEDDYEKKIYGVMKLVNLPEEMMNYNPNNLSYSNKKRLQLALAFCRNPQVIIFDNYDKGFNFRDQELLKKVLIKLKNKYHKTIIYITNELTSLLNLADNLMIIDKTGSLIYQEKASFFDQKIYFSQQMPPIVDFIFTCRKNGHEIPNYLDVKEIIKAVYRNVK